MIFKNKVKEMISASSFEKLEKYVEMIEEKNKVMNLTGFSGDRLWQEGIYESIYVLNYQFNGIKNKKILDIGAGAGFPSVPFLIANPGNQLTIFEPTKKRTNFLEEVNKELDLGIIIKNERIEMTDDEEQYDIITARAVASLKVLIEISHKPAKIGAKFAFFKGPKAKAEIHESRYISKDLNVNPQIVEVDTEGRENNLVIYTKNEITPKKFPRTWQEIIKK